MNEPPNQSEGEILRWTAKRKAAIVLDLIRGKTTAADAARQHGLTVAEVDWLRSALPLRGTAARAVRAPLTLPARHP